MFQIVERRGQFFSYNFANILGHSEINSPNRTRKICHHDKSF